MDKLDRVLNAMLIKCEDKSYTGIVYQKFRNEIKSVLLSGIQACQEPSQELTKENIEKIKNGSHTTLYATAPKRLGVEEIEVIIDAEPELPGDMPDEMWEKIKNNRELCVKSHRLAVSSTKENIKKAIHAAIEERNNAITGE